MSNFIHLRRCIRMTSVAALWFFAQLLNGQSGSDRIIVPLSDPSQPPAVKVEVMNGGVSVQGSDQKNMIIEAHTGSNDSGGSEHLTPDDLSVKEENNQVRITSYTLKRRIDLTILVPRRSSLSLSAVNHGDITVNDVAGEIEADNVNGAVTMRNVSGSVVAHSLNAPVIVILQKVDPQKPMAFSSMNGTVDVTFPSDIKADVSLQSGQGSIFSDFDIQLKQGGSHPITENMEGGGARYRVKAERTLRGTINGGGSELQFKNFNGSIYIRKSPS